MLFLFSASPLWWWQFGLPAGGAFSPLFLLWPPTLTLFVAMVAVMAGVALLSRRALEY